MSEGARNQNVQRFSKRWYDQIMNPSATYTTCYLSRTPKLRNKECTKQTRRWHINIAFGCIFEQKNVFLCKKLDINSTMHPRTKAMK